MTPPSDPLLQPLTIRHVTFKNRIMSTSHACGVPQGGFPTERHQLYHEEKARGGIALTMFGGSSNVSRDSAWSSPQINLHDERVIPYLQEMAERVHKHDAHLMCQITHLGGRSEAMAGDFLPAIGPSMNAKPCIARLPGRWTSTTSTWRSTACRAWLLRWRRFCGRPVNSSGA